MITVSKGKLKAKMLEYFRHVEETGEELVVTSHGTPTLRVIPIVPKESPDSAFAEIREKAAVYGDLTEPETDEWEDA